MKYYTLRFAPGTVTEIKAGNGREVIDIVGRRHG